MDIVNLNKFKKTTFFCKIKINITKMTLRSNQKTKNKKDFLNVFIWIESKDA